MRKLINALNTHDLSKFYFKRDIKVENITKSKHICLFNIIKLIFYFKV